MKRSRKWRSAIGAILLCAVLAVTPMTTWADETQPTNNENTPQQVTTLSETNEDQEANSKSQNDVNSSLKIYVSATEGNDESGTGTEDSPFKTLSHAVEQAQDGATIYVMSDLSVSQCVRVNDKSLTIEGNGNKVTRGDSMAQAQDNERSTYNPAMFEINTWNNDGSKHTLTLNNIVIDDAGIAGGTVFEPQTHGGIGGNDNRVQDSIVASYTTNTIVLGEGTRLLNYGGMSAVHVEHGGTLIMKSGSSIEDTKPVREDGHEAIWGAIDAQEGGIVKMEQGSSIENLVGRAIFLTRSEATLAGTIKNLTPLNSMRNGTNGLALFIWSDGKDQPSSATLQNGASISNLTENTAKPYDETSGAVSVNGIGSTFKMESGSAISSIKGMAAVFATNSSVDDPVTINGSITRCNTSDGGFLIRARDAHIILDTESVVSDNVGSSSGIIYSTNGAVYTFRGEVSRNKADRVIYLIDHGGAPCKGTVEKGARIVDNSGIGIYVNQSAYLTMNGGEISGNKVGVALSDKECSHSFVMNDGSITANSVGVSYPIYNGTKVQLLGGQIGENKNNYEVETSHSMRTAGSNTGDAYLEIVPNVLGGTSAINMPDFGLLELGDNYSSIKLGYTSDSVTQELNSQVTKANPGWQLVGDSTLWMQPSSDEVSFTVSPSTNPMKTSLYAVVAKLKDDGTLENEEPDYVALKNTSSVNVTLDGLTPGQSYAVMLVNSSEYVLAPDNITKYIGGGLGEEDNYDETEGFPAPTVTNCIDLNEKGDLNSLTVDGTDVDPENGTKLNALLDMLEVTYKDADGKTVTNDLVPGVYSATFSWKDPANDGKVKANGNDVTLGGEGTLIIRYISDIDSAQDGSTTYPLLTSEPTKPVEHAEAIAKKGEDGSDPIFYTNDDEARKIDSEGVQILDDSLLKDEGDNRQELLEQKAANYLGDPGQDSIYQYDFHYLDLVDSYDGNAWVSASNGTTVYLPYPEGVTKDIAKQLGVSVVHFKDLHREYGINGQEAIEQAINDCEVETMNAEFTDQGIKFDTERAGFSPFAIVWKAPACTISASAGEGGSISPSGTVMVAKGADKTFTMTPNDGYAIDVVTVDGKAVDSKTLVDENGLGQFTFKNVTANHSIVVSFKKNEETVTDDGGDQPIKPNTPNTNKPDQQQTGTQTDQNQTKVPNTSATASKNDTTNGILAATGDTIATAVVTLVAAGTVLLVGGYAIMKKRRQ